MQIKPNVYSWNAIQAANAHLISYNYQRDLDSHMMKNTEWGAVAYLQHSKYGSATSVRINNNSSITGYAAKSEPTCGYTTTNESCNKYESTSLGVDGTYTVNYKNTESQVASTTGNYTGIYDMSGGKWHWQMSILLDSTNSVPLSGRNSYIHSNFNGPLYEGGVITDAISFPSEKYFDKYRYSTSYVTFNRRILGDATAEFGPFANITYGSHVTQMGSWYNNDAWILDGFESVVARGGRYDYGLGAGMFSLESGSGIADAGVSFRIVLAIGSF